jgi:pilus assembly protein Flp/PilA
MQKILNFFKDKKGASAVEYAIMVALIAVVIIGTVTILGNQVNTTFTKVTNALPR